jgi:predicted metal-binding membrane protein
MSWAKAQDSRILAALLACLTGLAWWVLWASRESPWGHALLHPAHAMHMNIGPFTFGLMFIVGWTVMTIAMMLPTSSPLVMLFYRMASGAPNSHWLVGLLILGYLSVWAGFGAVAGGLNRAAASVSWLAQHEWTTGALVLLVAGAYQFSPLKYACLDKCRSPMLFIVERWSSSKRRPGDAFRLGATHGVYCVGCCWSLMLVMFAVSAGSLAWMLVLGIVMAVEKNVPWGRRLSAPVGAVLVVAAVTIAAVNF